MIVRAVKPIAKGKEVTVIKKHQEKDFVWFYKNVHLYVYWLIIDSAQVTTQYRGPNDGNVIRQLEIPQNW